MNDCIIRGDLANVRVGRHCVVKSRSVIRPPFKKFSKGYVIYLPCFGLGQDAATGWCILCVELWCKEQVCAIVWVTEEEFTVMDTTLVVVVLI